jgi:hypothetical protein
VIFFSGAFSTAAETAMRVLTEDKSLRNMMKVPFLIILMAIAFNPTLPKGFAPSRLDAIKMARSRTVSGRPVENTGVHRLNEMRAASNETADVRYWH